ncbi:MAG: Na/Pi cotransporter family protein [Pseudodesulfovibrio sp.]|uniref:Na/Pi-cotransporter II-related protein n=1 Tax=Pseudodesulfovibrio aespoeensis (strain ATCC 700646 / DSM 10631 / Aspo-2) TaxID=643562 RepID=E6VVG0_PSEA9|nr:MULTISPECIES: Na/Pi cotransporter family protein [Pseudodesulfovibrio]MBU4377799.1 Na/Pi cotransporter family protein [Pseudomonadota bacterium]ADU62404.1 Na/Pi-cotransporter II-related protein [Pseudodesulfovibrio aespoeensis Aspo-2]MBU4473931.1 Na/Pi cotransporter family protein [Pseudomonadota bacterium]MBU4515129.1 Na/Pi cotransporter family protein [Pseudomonadota bacterium]MBU4521034.1 Na/Pi cotransporter family protein [Pseudomonadota bacterium]
MTLSLLAGLIGGIGLFLIGMGLMTKGLRNAAGPALRTILGTWTRTPLHGLFSGFMITALVQSSSAVTVAVIGFVNAGLMTLGQSVGVIFGTNIGTTVTGWIVAAVGVSVEVKALALPMIGIGAFMGLTNRKTRRKHLGDALTGFGIFFLGIEVLQSSFLSVGRDLDLSSLHLGSTADILIFVAVGATLTLLMQSSSAAMALIITAAMSGLIPLESAAAGVVGTNIGTTSTAMFSAIGATSNAKKVAAAHILFNLGTGFVAVFLIPLLIMGVRALSADPIAWTATILALFHTGFNLLGVLIFLPLTPRLVAFLDRRIGHDDSEQGRPVYLDDNVLKAPTMAIEALFMELGRLGEMTRLMAQKGLASKFRHKDFIRDKTTLDSLIEAIRRFCEKLGNADLPLAVSARLPKVLRVVQYFDKTSKIMEKISHDHILLDHQIPGSGLRAARVMRREVRDILNVAHTPCAPEFAGLKRSLDHLQDTYHELKDELLRLGAQGRLELNRMVQLLDYYSGMRSMCEQAGKGTLTWAALRESVITCADANEANDYTWKTHE